MPTITEGLLAYGIRLQRYSQGSYKVTCPRCSAQRHNKTDPCLSVTIDADGAVWHCHHCSWSDGVTERQEAPMQTRRRKPAIVKPAREPGELTAAAMEWFEGRGISEATVRRNRVGVQKAFIPARQAEVDCIAFPYRRGGELINVKFRTLEGKDFAQHKGAEKILFGLDDIADAKTAVVVEGELDKLALEEAGFPNCVSVPDGAPRFVKEGEPSTEDAKFSYLANCADYLTRLDRIILAVDNDEPGRALEAELARRLGRERCLRVSWPDAADYQCKDANETLIAHGAAVLAECIEAAQPYPIEGLHTVQDFSADTLDLFRNGRRKGLSTGWRSIDELMTIREGELSVVTGVPNSGKSEFIDALMVNLAHRYGWRFALCSFENPPSEHIAKLVEKHSGQPFWDGPSPRMGEGELSRAMDWVADHFYLIRADEEAPTIDWILEAARGAVLRYGTKGLVIDPYNEVESKRPSNQTETEYVSQLLGKVKRFAQSHGVHVWFVAHPAKMLRESGSIPAPTLYDISGSANWANKADVGVVVHRDPNKDPTKTEIYVRKVRFKSVGKIGAAALRYERSTGRYADITAPSTPARAYRD